MNTTTDSVIGEIVAANYRYAAVFKKEGIDFCCNGNRTIGEACAQKGIDATELIRSLNEVEGENHHGSNVDYRSWPIDLLVDYIEKKHHRYVEQKTQEIKPYLEKIVRVHGAKHPELAEIEQLFLESAGDLATHMKKEELVLFPFIRKMAQAQITGGEYSRPQFGTVENPIAMMHHEHDTEGARFRKISELSNGYVPPIDACNTYKVTFALLKEFEDDLHLHIHLENNILFSEAINMEKKIYSK